MPRIMVGLIDVGQRLQILGRGSQAACSPLTKSASCDRSLQAAFRTTNDQITHRLLESTWAPTGTAHPYSPTFLAADTR
jgi:hypothetical protein